MSVKYDAWLRCYLIGFSLLLDLMLYDKHIMFTFMLRPTFDEFHKVLQCDMIVQISCVCE